MDEEFVQEIAGLRDLLNPNQEKETLIKTCCCDYVMRFREWQDKEGD